MKDPFRIYKPTLPVAYPQLVLEIVAERGHDPAKVLAQQGLPTNLLENPSGFITPVQYTQITVCAAEMIRDQGLGMEVGLRMRPTAHGFLGYALMSCCNLREALLLSLRFMRIRQRHIRCSFSMEGDTGVITLKEMHSFGPVRHFFIEGLLVGMARCAQYLVDDENLPGKLRLDYPEPDYFDGYRNRLPQTEFEKPGVQLFFPTETLQRPLRMADPFASKIAIEQCERELAFISHENDLVMNLREMLNDNLQCMPTLEKVAESFFMSGRTLKRRLKDNNTSFQQLVDAVRFEESQRLMRNPDLSLQQIAERLGYQDPANYTRAFRKWSGETPTRYRQRQVFRSRQIINVKR